MAVPDETVNAHIPAAANLICAVADGDADQIRDILTRPDLDLLTLAVLLASMVPDDVPLIYGGRSQLDRILEVTAAHLSVDPAAVKTASRDAGVTRARFVTAWIAHHQGRTLSEIGRFLGRDHSTIANAIGRVNREPRLRMAATVVLGLLDRTTLDEAAS